jgi:hypothetical protein
MSQTDPDDPPPQEDPSHDVPVYPEQDPPPGTESPIRAAAGPGEHDLPDEGEGVTHGSHGQPREGGAPDSEQANACAIDVDDDDLDPQAPHSPPDVGKGGVIFDENGATG